MLISRLMALATAVATAVSVSSSTTRNTIYDYANGKAYVHIVDGSSEFVVSLPFNQKYSTGSEVNTTIDLPGSRCKLCSANSALYAACPGSSNNTELSWYNTTSDDWTSVTLSEDFAMYEGSAYINTFDDPTSLYIYGGYDWDNDEISGRLLKVDLSTKDVSTVSTSVTPSAFYGSSLLKINYNTQLLIGGKTAGGWVGMSQLALWQYSAWSFKTVDSDKGDSVSSRFTPLLLPVFDDSTNVQEAYSTENFTSFSIGGVLMIGGSNPQFARLNLSGSNWWWDSLDTNVSLINTQTNSVYNDNLDLDTLLGAAVIYNTLITITADAGDSFNGTSSKGKRSTTSDSYYVKLYNTSTLGLIESVNYTPVSPKKSHSSSNKALIIALSVVLPILLIALLACLAYWLYKRHQHRKEEEENEKEMRDIMEFYQSPAKGANGGGNGSYSSFDSDVSGKPRSSQETATNDDDDVKVNNYDDGDNLSISSWRRKREVYEKQKKMHVPSLRHKQSDLSNPSTDSTYSSPSPAQSQRRSPQLQQQAQLYQQQQQQIRQMQMQQMQQQSNQGTIRRSLSNMSSQLGKSLRRSFSYQSSNGSFVASNTAPATGITEDDMMAPSNGPSMKRVQHSPPKQQSRTTLQSPQPVPVGLFNIPEDSSVSTFQMPGRSSPVKTSLYFHPKNGSQPGSPVRQSSDEPQYLKIQHQQQQQLQQQQQQQLQQEQVPSTPPQQGSPSGQFDPIFDDEEQDPNLDDVQILVSSTRRSKLRVTNPDPSRENSISSKKMLSRNSSAKLKNSPKKPHQGQDDIQGTMVVDQEDTTTTRRRVVSNDSDKADDEYV